MNFTLMEEALSRLSGVRGILYSMATIQDFEEMTKNIYSVLAQTLEGVEEDLNACLSQYIEESRANKTE